MSARIDPELTPAGASTPAPPPALALPPPLAVALDPDVDIKNDLPSDHPAWAKDAVALSQRVREFLAKLKPVAMTVLTFWDHRVRSIFIGNRKLSVDASGSYRLD